MSTDTLSTSQEHSFSSAKDLRGLEAIAAIPEQALPPEGEITAHGSGESEADELREVKDDPLASEHEPAKAEEPEAEAEAAAEAVPLTSLQKLNLNLYYDIVDAIRAGDAQEVNTLAEKEKIDPAELKALQLEMISDALRHEDKQEAERMRDAFNFSEDEFYAAGTSAAKELTLNAVRENSIDPGYSHFLDDKYTALGENEILTTEQISAGLVEGLSEALKDGLEPKDVLAVHRKVAWFIHDREQLDRQFADTFRELVLNGDEDRAHSFVSVESTRDEVMADAEIQSKIASWIKDGSPKGWPMTAEMLEDPELQEIGRNRFGEAALQGQYASMELVASEFGLSPEMQAEIIDGHIQNLCAAEDFSRLHALCENRKLADRVRSYLPAKVLAACEVADRLEAGDDLSFISEIVEDFGLDAATLKLPSFGKKALNAVPHALSDIAIGNVGGQRLSDALGTFGVDEQEWQVMLLNSLKEFDENGSSYSVGNILRSVRLPEELKGDSRVKDMVVRSAAYALLQGDEHRVGRILYNAGIEGVDIDTVREQALHDLVEQSQFTKAGTILRQLAPEQRAEFTERVMPKAQGVWRSLVEKGDAPSIDSMRALEDAIGDEVRSEISEETAKALVHTVSEGFEKAFEKSKTKDAGEAALQLNYLLSDIGVNDETLEGLPLEAIVKKYPKTLLLVSDIKGAAERAPKTYEALAEALRTSLLSSADHRREFVGHFHNFAHEPWAQNVIEHSAHETPYVLVDMDTSLIEDPFICRMLQQVRKYERTSDNSNAPETLPYKINGEQVRRTGLLIKAMQGRELEDADWEKIGVPEAKQRLEDYRATIDRMLSRFQGRIAEAGTSIPELDRRMLLEEEENPKLQPLRKTLSCLAARFLVQETDLEGPSGDEALEGLEFALWTGLSAYESVLRQDVPLYDKLYEEFDELREDGRRPTEVYLGRDGIHAYDGRRSQAIVQRRNEGVTHLQPKYLVYNRPMMRLQKEERREYLEQERVTREQDPIFFDTGYSGTIPEDIMNVMGFEADEINERIRMISADKPSRQARILRERDEAERNSAVGRIEGQAKPEYRAKNLIRSERDGRLMPDAKPSSPTEQLEYDLIRQAILRHYYLAEQERTRKDGQEEGRDA